MRKYALVLLGIIIATPAWARHHHHSSSHHSTRDGRGEPQDLFGIGAETLPARTRSRGGTRAGEGRRYQEHERKVMHHRSGNGHASRSKNKTERRVASRSPALEPIPSSQASSPVRVHLDP